MPSMIGVAGAVPHRRITQDEARRFAATLFHAAAFDVAELLPIFANSAIRERYLCADLPWFETESGFEEKSRVYREQGTALAEQALVMACERAGISPQAIDHLFFVSTTGIATPSLDAHLFNRLGLKPSLLRSPLWGLGCGGGIAAVSRAADWLRAHPRKIAAVAALELCSLTFLRNDLAPSNFVATALFGDGCGAAVLAGDDAAQRPATGRGLSITATGAVTWRDSLDVMGWEVLDRGLKVVFSKDIPEMVARLARPAVDAFLAENDLSLGDIRYFLSHPGGIKVIEAFRSALALTEDQVRSMRAVLSGNMSSATVFFVLEHFLGSEEYRTGELVLSSALGPGFFSEMIVARCL